MSIRSHALAFSSGVHGRSPSCWSKVSHRACRVSTHTRSDATLAALSITEVQDVRSETAVEPQKGDGEAKLGRAKVSRLEVPFELTGRIGPLHNQQEELQRHITTLGRELQWEKVQNMMKPAAQGLPVTAGILASAVIVMIKSRQWSLALELQQRAHTEGFVLGVGTRSAVLSTLGICGKWEECLKLLGEMGADGLEPTWRSMNATINALCQASEWKKALSVLDKLRKTDRGPDSFCYGAVIETCGNSGKWQTCLDLLQEMRNKGISTASVNYPVVLRACGSQGQWRAAVKLVDAIRAEGLQISSYSYTAVISACGRARQWKKAGEYLKEAEASGEEVHETTYNTVLSAYGRSGQVDKAMELVRAMQEKLPLGLVTYNAAITAFGQSKQPERAMAFFSEMKDNGVKPDYLTFTGLITAFARVGKWREAIAILDSMQSEGLEPNEITYSAAFSALAMAGHKKAAVAAHQLFSRMRSRGVDGNDRCYGKTIAACGNGGEWELAMDILHEIEDNRVSCGAQCYEAAIMACSKAKKWEYAMDLFRTAEGKFIDDAATLKPMYLLLVVTCIRSNQWPVAETFLDVMVKAGYQADEEFWTWALAASEKADRPDATIRLLERIRVQDLSVGVITYNVAIVALGKFGRWELALKILDEIGDMADIITYNSALHALSKAGQWEQAVALLHRMEAAGGAAKPDVISYTTVMGGLRRAGGCQHVLDLLKVMPTKGVTPNNYTYRAALLACAQAGRRQDTLDVLDAMVVRGIAVTERCIRSALKACAVGGSWEVAVALLDMVENTGRGARVDWIPDKTIYVAVLQTCTTAGQPRQALAVVERMQARNFEVGAEEIKCLLVMCASKSAWGVAGTALDMIHAETKVAMTLALTPLVQEHCHKKQWGRLSDLLLWMKTQDLTPDQALLRSVQDSFRKTVHWREVTTLVTSWRRELD